MVEKIGHYSLENHSTIYDEEALTALQLAGRTAAKANEVVEATNDLAENVGKELENFQNVLIPASVRETFDTHMHDGTFDDIIDAHMGDLEQRVDNLTGSIHEGSTTFDAEIIDARLGYDGTQFNTLGYAVREQFAKFARRYRNWVVGCQSIYGIYVDSSALTITVNVGTLCTLWSNNTFAVIRKADNEMTCTYPTGTTFMLCYSSAQKRFYTTAFNATAITEGDMIVAVFTAGSTGIVNKSIACDDIYNQLRVDGTYISESVDARTAYDGVKHDTFGIAIREQAKRFAQRYRNYVNGCESIYGIYIDTAAKTVRVNAVTNCILWGNNAFAMVRVADNVMETTYPVSGTYMLCYSSPEKKFYTRSYNASEITEGDYIVAVLYVGSTGNILKVIACDDIRKQIIVDGVKLFRDTETRGNNASCKIFRKVVCCGDSFTSGYIVDGDGVAHSTNHDYAYPHYMETITGNTWVNCGASGANVWTWRTRANGLPAAIASGKAQAYVVGLMLNDVAENDPARYIPLGSVSDIDTENQTYYGGLSKIVRDLVAISPKAKIFLCTCPRTDGLFPSYNQAVKDVVAFYASTYSVHCLDLLGNIELYRKAAITGDALGGHYTAIGYSHFADNLAEIMSKYIDDNVGDFQDVAFVEYE